MKKINDLTMKDFEVSACWEVEKDYETAKPRKDVINITESHPFLSKVQFRLADNSHYDGFCYAYDCSGFVMFVDGGQVDVSMYRYITHDEMENVASILNKNIETIFPIEIYCEVKVYGTNEKGVLDLDY